MFLKIKFFHISNIYQKKYAIFGALKCVVNFVLFVFVMHAYLKFV